MSLLKRALLVLILVKHLFRMGAALALVALEFEERGKCHWWGQ